MRALSKEAEQRLIGAIETAAEMVNAGATPNDAIVKSAAAANIPAGHINLMVHAYNTGRTTKQREQGEDTLEKAADFQLADINTVMAALYPEAVKTSAEIQRQETVSAEYALSPAGMLARRRAQQEKAASAAVSLPAPTYQPYPRDEQAAAQREYSQKRAAQLAAEEERRQVTMAEQKAAAALDTLADFFRVPGNMPFQDAVRQVELRFGEHGVSALNKVAEIYPHFKKQAATKNTYWGHTELYARVDATLTAVEDYATKQASHKKKFAASQKPISVEPVTGSVLAEDFSAGIRLKQAAPAPGGGGNKPSGGGNKPSGGGNKPSGENRSGIFGPISAVGGILGGVGGKGKEDKGPMTPDFFSEVAGLNEDPRKLKYRAFESITSPDHEMELKNIRAQAALHDMMLNDDIISGYEPHEVAVAFNEIADAAPNVVSSPAVLSAMLRKRLEAGQLADFDVKQLVEMDKIKAERDLKMLETKNLELGMVGGGAPHKSKD
jgi:hypothetical protein